MELTTAPESESRFYLESHQWDLEEAMSTYFNNSSTSTSSSSTIGQNSTSSNQPKPNVPTPNIGNTSNAPTSAYASKPKSTANRGGIKGFSDLKGDDNSDDEDEKVNWFTGGEKSGMVVQAPKNDKKRNKDEIIDDLMENAKKSGAKSIDEHNSENNVPFQGGGYRLGNNQSTSKPIQPTKKKEEKKRIVMWKNGFTFDNGPLRNYNDPVNAAFLEDIKQGKMPREIQQMGADLLVELMDSRNEDYVEPPKVFNSFTGSGNKLGSASTTPVTTTTTSSTSSSVTNADPIKVDESQPTTSIQIRCLDGSRLVGKFNHTHTVADIRKFIDGQKPKSNYDLFHSFPVKPIGDESQTISTAGLLNSSIIQKSK